ncbi:MAG: glycosyltransferase family 2 protein [Bacteroidales bacterium]|nr:glycosyltransferase family 2 protein [Bacteroidales bacterium]
MSSPLVSVIIPTYKGRGGLRRAVDSVLAQTYKNIEIIVVDDNSDGDTWRKETEAIMENYIGARVKYLKHKENKNGAAARNTGIKESTGDYVAFLDDDDYFLPDKILSQVDFLNNHGEYGAVYCQGIRNGRVIAKNLKQGNLSKDILLLQSHMYTPSLMFRRHIINELEGFDENFKRHQDYEILLRFFSLGYKIGAVQDALFVIGGNMGENILYGEKYEALKAYFFDKFDRYIHDFNEDTPGFISKVYVRHYTGVFISYIKYKDIKNAWRIYNKYLWNSPLIFSRTILKRVYSYFIKN